MVTLSTIIDGDSLINVMNATTATLYIAIATNFENYQKTNGNPTQKNIRTLADIKRTSYLKLLERHLEKYKQQYDRVSLTLPKSDNSSLPTDQRLKAFDGKDLDMVSLMMQYGRYLLISSSQPGGQAANLQGVWNNKMEAPWDSQSTGCVEQ